jgi:hypothetical protein
MHYHSVSHPSIHSALQHGDSLQTEQNNHNSNSRIPAPKAKIGIRRIELSNGRYTIKGPKERQITVG